MARLAAIVQARMTSTRLPGKVLERIGGRTVLDHVLSRCARIPGVSVVCCAAPEGAEHDAVAAEAERAGARVVRGPENDVLERYRLAADACEADVALRVTSDCPLIDPQLCAAVADAVASGRAAYAANNLTRGWPHGLDVEAFTRALLERAAREAKEPYQREHVTPWMRTASDVARENLAGPGGAVAELRVTLDFPEDLAFLRAVFEASPTPEGPASVADLVALLEGRADLLEINAAHGGKSRPAASAGRS